MPIEEKKFANVEEKKGRIQCKILMAYKGSLPFQLLLPEN